MKLLPSAARPPLLAIARAAALAAALVVAAAACERSDDGARLQGYVEGEFVQVAAPAAGQLTRLHVQRGDEVHAGDPLFAVDDAMQRAALDRAQGRLEGARARLADEQKGQRPTELQSLEAQLAQARAARELAAAEFQRFDKVVPTGAAAANDLDRARAELQRSTQLVAQLEADLATARLPSREDRVAAAAADVTAAEAELARARWDLDQQRQRAPADARVFDVLWREGEWVPAGAPVVALLPPANVLVRAFVPEPRLGGVRVGDAATIAVDGAPAPARGTVAFVSPRAEFTPPVIYSYESRQKFVFLVEIRFAPDTAARLHPGQPVDVRLDGR